MNRSACVIQFSKSPVPGTVKTRMQPYLSAQVAAKLHRQLTVRTIKQLTHEHWDYRFYWSGQVMPEWLSSLPFQPSDLFEQVGNDLGERMHRAFMATLNHYSNVVLVGSDCPFLSQSHINVALEQLAEGQDVVLVPADDGGYVLIALRQPQPCLFNNIPWGTPDVLSRTLAVAEQEGLSVYLTEPLADIDRPEDLECLKDITEFDEFFALVNL